jgi:hypothetical protein
MCNTLDVDMVQSTPFYGSILTKEMRRLFCCVRAPIKVINLSKICINEKLMKCVTH